MSYFAHSTAVLDPGVVIGEGTRVWHFCHLSGSARLGAHCNLGQNVYVGERVVIGNRVKIQNNVSVFAGVELQDEVFLGPSVVFTNVRYPRAGIERKEEFVATRVEQGASLGANVTVICGVTVGAYAMVGAGSVVTKDVPPFALVVGNPARQVGWVSEDGQPTDAPPRDSWPDLLKSLAPGAEES